MNPQKQARISLHQRRLAKDLTVTALAKRIRHSREAVSRAINRGQNPHVLKKVKEVLGE